MHHPFCRASAESLLHASHHPSQNFNRVLFPDDYAQYNGDDADNPQDRFFLFTGDEVRSSIQLMMSRYWALPQLGLAPIDIAISSLLQQGSGGGNVTLNDLPYPTVTYTYIQPASSGDSSSSGSSGSLDSLFSPTAPFPLSTATASVVMANESYVFPVSGRDQEGMRSFFANLVSLTYDLRMRVHDPLPDASFITARACFEWQSLVTYDFSGRSHVEVLWWYNLLRRCPDDPTINTSVAGLTIASLIAAILHELITFAAVIRWTRLFFKARARQQVERESAAWRFLLESKGKGKGKGEHAGHTHSAPHVHSSAVKAGRPGEVSAAAEVAAAEEVCEDVHDDCHTEGEGSDAGAQLHPDADDHVMLRAWDLLRLLRPWLLLSSAGSILLAVHCGLILASGVDVSGYGHDVVIGASSAMLWLSLLRYLDVTPQFYSTILTLQMAVPKIVRFLIGVLPIFAAFAFFAMVAFNTHAVRYADATFSFMTLFSFINGDALTETFQHTEGRSASISYWLARNARRAGTLFPGQGPAAEGDQWWSNPTVARGDWAYGLSYYTLVGDLYLMLSILVFMYVVLNCMIAVIEESFFTTRSEEGDAALLALKLRELRLRAKVARLASGAAPGTAAADVDMSLLSSFRSGGGGGGGHGHSHGR